MWLVIYIDMRKHPIYAIDTNMGSSISCNDFHIVEDLLVVDEQKEDKEFVKRQKSLNEIIALKGYGPCI